MPCHDIGIKFPSLYGFYLNLLHSHKTGLKAGLQNFEFKTKMTYKNLMGEYVKERAALYGN